MDIFAKELKDHKKIKKNFANAANKKLSLTVKRRENDKNTSIFEY